MKKRILYLLSLALCMNVCMSLQAAKLHTQGSYDEYINDLYHESLTRPVSGQLKFLFGKVPDINTVYIRGKKRSALHHAIEYQYRLNTRLLLDAGANAAAADADQGITTLMWAFRFDMVKIATRLIEGGADVSAQDDRGRSVLYWACGRRMPINVIRSLFDHGARIREDNLLQWAVNQGNAHSVIEYLYEKSIEQKADQKIDVPVKAVLENDAAGLREYLAKRKKNFVNGSIEVYTASLAASLGKNEMLDVFRETGFDIIIPPKGEMSCLQYACANGQLHTVKMLMQLGANPNTCITGKHPLILAVRGNHKKVFEHLLASGIEPFVFENSEKMDIIEYALCYSDIEIAEKLVSLNEHMSQKKNRYYTNKILDTADPLANIAYLKGCGYSSGIPDTSGSYVFTYAIHDDYSFDIFKAVLDDTLQSNPQFTDSRMKHNINIFINMNAHEKLKYFLGVVEIKTDFSTLKQCIEDYSYESFILLYGRSALSQQEKDRLLYEQASNCHDERFARYLIEQGANINSVDEKGNTALMNCAINGIYDTSKALIELGADTGLRNSKRLNVRDIALITRFRLLQSLLKSENMK